MTANWHMALAQAVREPAPGETILGAWILIGLILLVVVAVVVALAFMKEMQRWD